MTTTSDQHANASAHLTACDPDWGILIDLVGQRQLSIDKAREPFHALVHAVAHQQLHGRAAQAIFKRFLSLYPDHPFPPAQNILATDDATLRACGFSLAKIATIRGIALGALEGLVPTRREADTMSDEALITQITTLHDFGVREGWRLIKGMDKQPKPKELASIGEPWAPYRSTAAWYLWRAVDQYKLAMTKGQKQA